MVLHEGSKVWISNFISLIQHILNWKCGRIWSWCEEWDEGSNAGYNNKHGKNSNTGISEDYDYSGARTHQYCLDHYPPPNTGHKSYQWPSVMVSCQLRQNRIYYCTELVVWRLEINFYVGWPRNWGCFTKSKADFDERMENYSSPMLNKRQWPVCMVMTGLVYYSATKW